MEPSQTGAAVKAGAGANVVALRPEALFAVFASVRGLKGVGPATLRLLARLLDRPEPRRLDLLAHRPVGLVDTRPLPSLSGLAEGDTATFEA
ncbi:MAG TPA: hypothetical protein VF606_11100, partial [Geminicoccaceae bacterium]